MLLQIKGIGDNSVKVLVEKSDIQKFDIPLSVWKEGARQCGDFLYVLLAEVYHQTGISFMDCEVLTEIIEGIDEEYYVVMTKAERKECPTWQKAPLVYRVERLQDLFPIAAVLSQNISHSQSSLYKYRGAFYLVLRFVPDISASLAKLYACRIQEFAVQAGSAYFADLLMEYGKKIGGDRVLDLFIPGNLSTADKRDGVSADRLG